jgi:hypothetical protein
MDLYATNIDPQRLVDAAVAVETGLADLEAAGGRTAFPTDLLGTARQPRSFSRFTRTEIEQASVFLVRLGLIDPRGGGRR